MKMNQYLSKIGIDDKIVLEYCEGSLHLHKYSSQQRLDRTGIFENEDR